MLCRIDGKHLLRTNLWNNNLKANMDHKQNPSICMVENRFINKQTWFQESSLWSTFAISLTVLLGHKQSLTGYSSWLQMTKVGSFLVRLWAFLYQVSMFSSCVWGFSPLTLQWMVCVSVCDLSRVYLPSPSIYWDRLQQTLPHHLGIK